MRFIDTESLTRTFSRTYADESALAFSAIDCILSGEKGVYASTELTTGRRAQAMLRELGASRSAELQTRMDSASYAMRVWDPNVAAATSFARRLHRSLGGNQLVITPAPFMAPGWNQPEYLGFWETLIRTRIKAIYFNEGWEYSDGCTFEFSVAHDAGLPTFAANGASLPVAEAVARISAAIEQLRGDAIDSSGLTRSLERLRTSPRIAG